MKASAPVSFGWVGESRGREAGRRGGRERVAARRWRVAPTSNGRRDYPIVTGLEATRLKAKTKDRRPQVCGDPVLHKA
jgi:hypothetical protein